jgi:hypothetical protein
VEPRAGEAGVDKAAFWAAVRSNQSRIWQALVLLLIVLGIGMRLSRYAANQSLMCDEAALGVNIIGRSFAGLLQPLTYDQGAPVGFLLGVKLIASIFGYGEASLRLLPILAGMVSVPLFYLLAREVLSRWGAVIALALFAGCWQLVNYSHFMKQYSSDVAIAVALVLIALRWRSPLAVGIAGAVAIWFSHPAAFVLAAIAATLLTEKLIERRYRELPPWFAVAAGWGICLLANYLAFLRHLTHNHGLVTGWQDWFLPLSLVHAPGWFAEHALSLFRDLDGTPAARYLAPVTALLAIVGAVRLFRERPRAAGFLVLPLVLAVAASGVRAYPFGGRLCFFLLPALILLAAAGIEETAKAAGRRQAAAVVLLAALVAGPAMAKSLYGTVTQPGTQEMRPLMSRIAQAQEDGDSLLLHTSAEGAVVFYQLQSPRYSLAKIRDVETFETDDQFRAALDKLVKAGKARRIWLIVSYDSPVFREDERRATAELDKIGVPRLRLTEFGASAFLYEADSATAAPRATHRS